MSLDKQERLIVANQKLFYKSILHLQSSELGYTCKIISLSTKVAPIAEIKMIK
jgi:hypothetical protein